LRGRSTPHPLITEIAQQHGREPKSLTNAEYCAAHLVRTVCNQILDKVSTVLTVCITLLQTQHTHSLTHTT
jgi:hypothetical protein